MCVDFMFSYMMPLALSLLPRVEVFKSLCHHYSLFIIVLGYISQSMVELSFKCLEVVPK